MQLLRTLAIVVWLAGATTWTLSAEDKVFFMELPPNVLPAAVGGNAFAVAGVYYSPPGGLLWMPTSGDRRIGGIGVAGISLDGKTIAGTVFDSQLLQNAAIWTGGTEWRLLGPILRGARPCDNLLTSSYGATRDGKAVVGLGWDGCNYAHGFRWEESTGMVDLGSLNARSTRANGISDDGKVIVGFGEHETGVRIATKWVSLRQEFINGPAGPLGEARGTNNDGSIIVGDICSFLDVRNRAWKWTARGGVTCYEVPRPSTVPLAGRPIMSTVSNDGRVIGGSYTFGLDAEALLWIDDEVHFLKDYLRANGHPNAFEGWVNTGFITAVSPDGRTVVGYGAGRTTFQGYLIILPELER